MVNLFNKFTKNIWRRHELILEYIYDYCSRDSGEKVIKWVEIGP